MELEILVGPIASGKSTYSKARARQGYIVINDDSLFLSLHAGQYKLYKEHLNPLYKAIETNIIITSAAMRLPLIIDRPCHKRATRQRYINLAKTFGYNSRLIIFDSCEAEVSATRRMKDNPRDMTFEQWLKAAKRHLEEYETPDPSENYNELLQSPKYI